MNRPFWLALAFALTGAASAADLAAIDRRVPAEPAYQTKAPKYALMVIGPGTRDRVWMVKDGEELHVLAGEQQSKLSPTKERRTDDERTYELAELRLNGRTHANLRARVGPLRRVMLGEYAKRPELKAAIEKDPNAETLSVSIEAELPHLKARGRVGVYAGMDLNGALLLAAKPAEAPVVHVGGPLEVTIQATRPTLLRGRPNQVEAVVGSRGAGPGTFAVLGYEGVLPEGVRPRLSVQFPPLTPGGEASEQRYELPDRC